LTKVPCWYFFGQIIALKLENLSMGMKADEMSSSDEELLLKFELS